MTTPTRTRKTRKTTATTTDTHGGGGIAPPLALRLTSDTRRATLYGEGRTQVNDYNQTEHSKLRLGAVGHIPVVPMMPVAAQVSVMSGMLHLKFDGGVYVRTGLPSLTPNTYATVVKAIKSQPTEQSYSLSPSQYYVLSVAPDPSGL